MNNNVRERLKRTIPLGSAGTVQKAYAEIPYRAVAELSQKGFRLICPFWTRSRQTKSETDLC